MPLSFQIAMMIAALWSLSPHELDAADSLPPQLLQRQHADQSFQELSRQEQQGGRPRALSSQAGDQAGTRSTSTSDEYLKGVGEGDLTKGRMVCQRVAELAARTEIAKQIRVRVTEHAVDRVRERMGRAPEQDLEVVREEMVNELLRDVRIVDKRVDEAAGICLAVAVMPKSRITTEMSPQAGDPVAPITPPQTPHP